MSEQSTALVVPAQMLLASKKIDDIVRQVAIQAKSANGFEMAFVKATAIKEIKNLLTPEYMDTIIDSFRGKQIGFMTDLDRETTDYSIEKVKECLIEAVLTGLEPINNQFNILAGKMYPTKNGFSHLLRKLEGLSYSCTPGIPKIVDGGTQVSVDLEWEYQGVKKKRTLTFAIKVNANMGSDAIVGKAERKAKKWLYNDITGSELGDGDVQDAVIVSNTENVAEAQKKADNFTKTGGMQPKTKLEVKHEEAEIVHEEVDTDTGEVKPILEPVSEKEQIKLNDYLKKAKDLADLEKRKEYVISKKSNANLSVYDELKLTLK